MVQDKTKCDVITIYTLCFLNVLTCKYQEKENKMKEGGVGESLPHTFFSKFSPAPPRRPFITVTYQVDEMLLEAGDQYESRGNFFCCRF